MFDRAILRSKGVNDALDYLFRYLSDSVIYEDSNVIAFNKPSGLSVQGGSGIRVSVDDVLKSGRFGHEVCIVHRLDKDASGVLLAAKNRFSAALLSDAFRRRLIKKQYVAITGGYSRHVSGSIVCALKLCSVDGGLERVMPCVGGKVCTTDFSLISSSFNNGLAFWSLRTHFGRKHQVRAHMSYLGFPVIGDHKYGGEERFGLPLCLHASDIDIPKLKSNFSALFLSANPPCYITNLKRLCHD